MAFYIEKMIFHNRAPFEHLELSFKNKDIILLNAVNGGGKTTVLSHIADAFHELARKYYSEEFEGRQLKFYRILSPIYNLDPDNASIVYIRFNLNGEQIDYVDICNNTTADYYDKSISIDNKIPFSSFSNQLEKRNGIKLFSSNLNEQKAKGIFGQNIATYFPSYRFEYPGYLNDVYKPQLKFDCEERFDGYLPNPIEVITDLPKLANWLMDVVLDGQIYKEQQNVNDGNNTDDDATIAMNRIIISLNSIINHALSNKYGTLRLGIGKRTNPGQRISVMLDTENKPSIIYYPSIFNISAGEACIITMFGEILRQADNLGKYSDISGIVIIDEIDKHLHIKLQKEILPRLFGVFPNIQFILSSHSPFVSMGLANNLPLRSKIIDLSGGEGIEITPQENPLYEEVYQMMLNENEQYKKMYEALKASRKEYKLLVEDSYAQIYKIAWLKLKGIDFDKDNLDVIFDNNSDFEIIRGNDCNGIAGILNAKSTELYKGMKIIGLFDYDQEGSEKFYNLKEGFNKKDILGNLSTGFYKTKTTVPDDTKIFALLLPVPERLHSLISRSQNEKDKIWTGDGKFANYVEIETLLPVSYLQSTTGYESNNICGTDYFKAKDENKKSLWKDLILQDKEVFADFIPLFQAIHSLFGLSEFLQ
mgnify:CR=1 FL=1